ncbi:MAG: tyrosine-type recombinase/integrase, partial [bacterium]|nr:tyrosine-type recombinase/integrase [bacterium]
MKTSNKSLIKHIPFFLEYCEVERGLSNSTIKNYDNFLLPFKNWLIKNNLQATLPSALNSKHIWDYRLYLSRYINPYLKSNLRKSTQNYYLIALRALLLYFAERDISSLSPEKIKLGKDKKSRAVKFLSINQIEKLLLTPNIKTFSGLRDRAILEVLFSTGLRVSELVNLNIDSINLEVLNKYKNKDLEFVIIGKGSHARTVYLSGRAIKWLIFYLNKRHD